MKRVPATRPDAGRPAAAAGTDPDRAPVAGAGNADRPVAGHRARCIGVAVGQVTSYGAVVSRTPVYGWPDAAGGSSVEQREGAAPRDPRAIRLLGFDVVYDYRGRRFCERMPSNPGNRIRFATTFAG
ncbi:MAG: hypothetical protein AB7P21_31540 [Lautropia sp.]